MASDYITLAELKATLSLTAETYADADISAAITAASRAIDKITRRRFWLDVGTTNVRFYSPDRLTRLDIDDLVTLTSVTVDSAGNGTWADTWTLNTDFVLEPLNAAEDGFPWEKIIVHPLGKFLFPTSYPRSVQITGQFGWSAIPSGVVDYTTILATVLLRRKREAPFGIVAMGMDGGAIRIARTDPQAALLIGPYIRTRYSVA